MSKIRKTLEKQLTNAFLEALRSGSREPLERFQKQLKSIQYRSNKRNRNLTSQTRSYCSKIGSEFYTQRENILHSCNQHDDAKMIALKLQELEKRNASLPLRKRHKRTDSNKHKHDDIQNALNIASNIPLKTQGFTNSAFRKIAKDVAITTSLTLTCIATAHLSGIFNPLSIPDYIATASLTLLTTSIYFIHCHAKDYLKHSSQGMRTISKKLKTTQPSPLRV